MHVGTHTLIYIHTVGKFSLMKATIIYSKMIHVLISKTQLTIIFSVYFKY